MPIVPSHTPGAPCWFELGTTDQNAANEFYKTLFGWEIVDAPIGDGMVYTTYRLNNQAVGAGFTLMPQMREAGVPPHWGVYFHSSDADATAAKVSELGGKVLQPAMDVFEFGRLAAFLDPEGAAFAVWQPKIHQGATIVGEPNTVCWSELATRDIDKAASFYRDLFGWSTKDSTGQPVKYYEFTPAGASMSTGGMIQMDAQWEGVPAHWMIYFRVADCDTTVTQINQLGGKVCHGPFQAPGVGTIAVCSDPQGAMFSVIQLLDAA